MQSLTIQGLAVAIVLPIIVQVGFTESCANEIVAIAPMLPGIVMAWIGRVRQGDITIFGSKK